MKKLILLFLIAPLSVFSQKQKGEMVATAGAGWSVIGALFSVSDVSGDVSTSVSPVIHASFDYGLTRNMSIGAAVGYQRGVATFSDYEYYNSANQLVTENFEWKVSILNIGARALFHYGRNEDFDMYSGVRFGYRNINSEYETTDTSFDDTAFENLGSLGFQLVAFGARGYFTPNLGFNAELAFGSPYFIMGGLNYRFGGGE
jgi:hypothetical protein